MTTNLDRARWGEQCVELFTQLTGADTPEDQVSDLIADLGHYCDASRLAFIDLLIRAIQAWHVEKINPDYFGDNPKVVITINNESYHS